MAIDQSILTKIKNHIRIRHNVLDDDWTDEISACLADLKVVGVQDPQGPDPQEMDPLILNAVKLWCRAAATDDPTKAAAYMARYDALKASLMMAEGYCEGAADE